VFPLLQPVRTTGGCATARAVKGPCPVIGEGPGMVKGPGIETGALRAVAVGFTMTLSLRRAVGAASKVCSEAGALRASTRRGHG
jgi:hypothetical protein